MGQKNSKATKTSYKVEPVTTTKDLNNKPKNETPIEAPKKEPKIEPKKEPEYDMKLVPAWLKEECFTDLLKIELKDFVKIENFKAYPALAPGENYATMMLRVNIKAKLKDNSTKEMEYVMKVPHESEQMQQMLAVANFFVPENLMYFEVIPVLEKTYQDAGLNVTFAPKAFTFPKPPTDNYVLLDDLRPLDFKNANRLECLDMKHTKAVLRKMAQFHAVSAHHVATKGPFPALLMDGMINDLVKDVWEAMMTSFKMGFLGNLKLYKDGEKYRKFVESFFDHLTDELIRQAVYNPEEFNVLNHGDSWSNNILFKYEPDGTIADVCYVDFQMSKFGSPAQDLLYFIMSSVNIKYKLKHFDFFIRYYYDNLIEHLTLLKYPKRLPALREIHIDLFKNGSWAFMTSFMTLPVVLLDSSESSKMDNFMSNDAEGVHFKNLMYTNARYRGYIDEILPWLYNRGLMTLDFDSTTSPVKPATVSNAAPSAQAEPAVAKPSGASKTPDWITASLFEDVVKQNFENYKLIKNFEVGPATKSGDNYASLLLKVDMDVELSDGAVQPASYMLKIAPPDQMANEMLSQLDTFDKEKITYDELIPEFERIYRDVGKTDVVFGPKCYHFTKDIGCEAILLKNLRLQGFKNADRLQGCDTTHVEHVLKKLAQFHAASACWIANGGKVPPQYKKSQYSEEARPMMEQMGEIFYNLVIDAMKNYKGHEEYIDKVIQYKSTMFDLLIKASTVNENDFNVINHGDCWTNNILFQYNADGSIKNTYFVDYQMVIYSSPAIDLYYFLMSSPSLDIKVSKFDYFIEYYHKELKHNLELLKYPKTIPTLEQLQADLKKYGIISFNSFMGVTTAVLLDPTEDASMSNMLSDSESGMAFKKSLYNNKRYVSHAEVVYPWLNQRGILDIKL